MKIMVNDDILVKANIIFLVKSGDLNSRNKYGTDRIGRTFAYSNAQMYKLPIRRLSMEIERL